jgi:ornithine--oxo-acid transaminase
MRQQSRPPILRSSKKIDLASLAVEVKPSADLYREYVNPQWARLLDVLRMNVRYTRCLGAELRAEDGRRVLDFLSGYCVHNTGHNHPYIVQSIQRELLRNGPAMLQSHACDLAGELAARLIAAAGGRVNKAFFCSSGSEGIEAAIKFSRAHTGRDGILCFGGAFHGLTCGALSLMDQPFWRQGFGPLLPGVEAVPFGDLAALGAKLRTKKFAALIAEPIQAEAGVRIPPPGYLETAQDVCRETGTMFVLDEVQTGMYRTGRFLAGHHFHLDPDMIVLAKALSGGLIPCAAVLLSDAIYDSVYGSLDRSIVHTSTFSENNLAMRAGLATLEVLERERLGRRAAALGEALRRRLREALSDFEMVKDVRGMGLLNGIEFAAPRRLSLRAPFEVFRKIHPGMFGQVIVMRLFRDHGILTQMCGNNFMVLKVAPPLVIDESHADEFVRAIRGVVNLMHASSSFWTEAMGLARRVTRV